MARVFLSYSSRDRDQAAELFAWLKRSGFDQGFLDIDKHQGIPVGASWERQLYDQLERAQAVILVLTENWFESKWCFAEFTQARSRGKPIFPVVISSGGDRFVGDDLQKLDLTYDRAGGLRHLADRLAEVALLSQGGFELPSGRPPYPGFLAFDEEDAATYFGRDDNIRRLIQRLDSRRIEGGRRFVLVLGASGTGKSSLIRAGLIPRLKRAKREWIVVPPLRPEADPFEGLAISLLEAGCPVSPVDLVDAEPDEIARALGGAHDARRAGILIAVDQAEELFTRVSPTRRDQFLAFLSRLLAPGLPFVVVATLRSDHLGELQSCEALTAEFEDFTLRPLPIERIGDIVKGPARIAGLDVEDELVARIMADARTSDALPLVAYALRRLYDQFSDAGKIRLVDYESLRDVDAALSPLETVVRETAAQMLADEKPSEAELKALREAFVPGLVRANDEGGFVRQPARWDALPEASRHLIAALASPRARLLVIRDKDGDREVEVAHEALFRVWPLLAGWLREEEEFLIGRNRLEKALRDWESLPAAEKNKGLITGILLDRAKGWLADNPNRFSQIAVAFIEASAAAEAKRQREAEEQRQALEAARLHQAETELDAARRIQHRTRIAAIMLGAVAVVAVGAGGFAIRAQNEATQQTAIATQNFDIARQTVDHVVFDLAQGLRSVEGMRVENLRTILTRAASAVERLSQVDPNDRRLLRSKSVMLMEMGDTYSAAGDGESALASYEESLSIARRLAESDPADTGLQRDVSVSLERIADLKLKTQETAEASAAYAEGLAIAHRLADADPWNIERQRDLSFSLNDIGDTKLQAGDLDGALDAYTKGLAIARRLVDMDHDNAGAQRNVALSLDKIGRVKLEGGDAAGALAAWQKSLAVTRHLADQDSGNTELQSDVSVGLERIGDAKQQAGDIASAIVAYEKSLAVRRHLADIDPGNTDWQRLMSLTLERMGDAKNQAGDTAGAGTAYEEGLTIARRLTEIDPENSEWQRDLSVSLDRIGVLRLQEGDIAAAGVAFKEALTIARHLGESAPDKKVWQGDLEDALGRVALTDLLAKNFDHAEAVSRDALNNSPQATWSSEAILAHALMLQGKTAEADRLYLGNRGSTRSGQLWEDFVATDFAYLRARGIDHPHMADVERAFSLAPAAVGEK